MRIRRYAIRLVRRVRRLEVEKREEAGWAAACANESQTGIRKEGLARVQYQY